MQREGTKVEGRSGGHSQLAVWRDEMGVKDEEEPEPTAGT